jgi:hypothetical protein
MLSMQQQGPSCKLPNFIEKGTIQMLLIIMIFSFIMGCSTPKLMVESSSYNFADTELGESAGKDITIENKGKAELKINNIDISGERFYLPGQKNAIVIYPNQKYVLNIKFTPNESGIYSGIMSINSNDPANKVFNIQFQGKGIEPKLPEIKVYTTSLDFQKVNIDSGLKKPLLITNTGNAILLISDLKIIGDGFVVDKMNQAQLKIAPNEAASLNIEFKPVKSGNFSGVLNVYSNDMKNTITSVTLKGEGNEIAPIINNKSSQNNNNIMTSADGTTSKGKSEPPVVISDPRPPVTPVKNANYLGSFTHDEVKGTMRQQEGTMERNSEMAFSFDVQKLGDFEILVTPGYELVSNEFSYTEITTFTDKSRYKRYFREKVAPNSSFAVTIKRKENSPDNYTFIFKLFPR